jgi:hypothetical protein
VDLNLIVEPLVKRVAMDGYTQKDIAFLTSIACHGLLAPGAAANLLEVLGMIYLEDPVFARTVREAFMALVARTAAEPKVVSATVSWAKGALHMYSTPAMNLFFDEDIPKAAEEGALPDKVLASVSAPTSPTGFPPEDGEDGAAAATPRAAPPSAGGGRGPNGGGSGGGVLLATLSCEGYKTIKQTLILEMLAQFDTLQCGEPGQALKRTLATELSPFFQKLLLKEAGHLAPPPEEALEDDALAEEPVPPSKAKKPAHATNKAKERIKEKGHAKHNNLKRGGAKAPHQRAVVSKPGAKRQPPDGAPPPPPPPIYIYIYI